MKASPSLSVTCLLAWLVRCSAETQPQTHLRQSSASSRRRLTESCVGVLRHVDYAPGSPQLQEHFLACETPSGNFYRVPVSSEWIQDKLSRGELKSGHTALQFAPGTQVDEARSRIHLTGGPPGLVNRPGTNNRRLAAKSGPKTVLAVIVKTAEDPIQVTFDETTLYNHVFDSSGAFVNLKTQLEACSFGQTTFSEAPDRSGGSLTISNGVVRVAVSKPASSGDWTVENAVTNTLKSAFGVTSPQQLADHVMYCFPAPVMSGIAYGYVDSWLTVYKDNWCLSPSAQMHELGHNMDLDHSGEGSAEYDDQTGVMGFSYSYDKLDRQKMCYNAAKSWQLGWYSNKAATYTPSCDPLTIPIGSIVDYEQAAVDTVLLQLQQPSNTDGVHYYMTYNAAASFNSQTAEAGNRLIINSQAGNGVAYFPSLLVGKLDSGNTLILQNYDGKTGDTLSVTFTGRGGFETRQAFVDIVWTPSNPGICGPSPTGAPTVQPTSAPTTSPTLPPTVAPTVAPTGNPTDSPSVSPTSVPTTSPTVAPTAPPTVVPTGKPTSSPVVSPTSVPTTSPTPAPTGSPTVVPTGNPTSSPTDRPSKATTAGCPAGQVEFRLDLQTDGVASETSWELKDSSTRNLLYSFDQGSLQDNTFYQYVDCIDNVDYTFLIQDAGGNGGASFSLYFDCQLIASGGDYGRRFKTNIASSAGYGCVAASPTDSVVPSPSDAPVTSPVASPVTSPVASPVASPVPPETCSNQGQACNVASDCCDFRAKCDPSDKFDKNSPLVCSK